MRLLVLAASATALLGCGRFHFDALVDGADTSDAPAARELLYVATTNPDQILAYTIADDGTLTPLAGSPVATTLISISDLAVDPLGQFLVATAASTTHAAAAFALGSDGLPSQVSVLDNVNGFWSATFAPTGRFIYTADDGVMEYQLSLDRTTGELTQLGATMAVSATPEFIAIERQGRFMLTPGGGNLGVTTALIDSTTGAIGTQTAYHPAMVDDAISLAIDATSTHVYIANDSNCDLFAFPLDPTTGAILIASPLPGAPVTVDCFVTANLSPDSTRLYAGTPARSTTGDGVYMFNIDALTGGLGAPILTAADVGVAQLVFDPSGRFAYGTAADPEYGANGMQLFGYAVDPASGELTTISSLPIRPGGTLAAVATLALP